MWFIYYCKMSQKELWESDILRKDATKLLASLLKVLLQKWFSHRFCWSKPITGTISINKLIMPDFNYISVTLNFFHTTRTT